LQKRPINLRKSLRLFPLAHYKQGRKGQVQDEKVPQIRECNSQSTRDKTHALLKVQRLENTENEEHKTHAAEQRKGSVREKKKKSQMSAL